IHVFLLSTLIYWYPGKISKNDWLWDEGAPFFANRTSFSEVSGLTTQEYVGKVYNRNLIFPDIVLSGQSKKVPLTTKIKNKIPQISIRSILTQVGKFPGRLKKSEISKKPLSGQVGKILTLLTPVTLQNILPEKKSLNLNPVELKGYHQQLKGFLSERWEVPIHLIESQFTAVIQLEITKNGRLLSWSIEESANSALNKTVKKLLKNLRFLPSLPESYPEDSYKFGVRFTPANFQL
ncbi:MAG: TonB C-terminal domain-containing protein, partial [SAR324 cluster bacterium]|nr:TonB C-terminal domain-containing protein [SAR324 cluster bacterium]